MEIYDEAIACYKKALLIHPNVDGYKTKLQIVEEKYKIQEMVLWMIFCALKSSIIFRSWFLILFLAEVRVGTIDW